MKLWARGLAWLCLLLAVGCVAEGGHCLNPQPDLPCSNGDRGPGQGGTTGSNPGAAGALAVENPPNAAGATSSSAGATAEADGGPLGEAGAGATEGGAAGAAGASTDNDGVVH